MSQYQNFIDQYEIIKSLGSGNFAEVKLAKEKATGQLVSLKLIDKTKCDEDAFKKEYLIQRHFDSPYIIDIISYFEDTENFVIVMEYANGGELFDAIIENGPFSENDAARLIQQILIGLKLLHDNKIIHRDLKPENILISKDEKTKESTIKISDFGLARLISGEKIITDFLGTMYYAAPEIISKRPYDSSIDIWSLGVVIYVLLSAFYPFEAETSDETKEKILAAKYDFNLPEWDYISEQGKDFVKQMLQLDPEKRISIDDALKHPWMTGNAPKLQLPDLRDHLRKYNLNRRLKNVTSSTRAVLSLKKIAGKKITLKPPK